MQETASEQQIPAQREIIIRKIPFDFDEATDPIWNREQPEWSHMFNGVSLAMPYTEPFMSRTIREAAAQLTDPKVKEDARIFIAQEGQHYQTHRRYNDLLKQNGYPELSENEAKMQADYDRLQKKSLKWRLAYTAGFETATMGITKWLISDRRNLFANADPTITSFILWHMVEETEHKTVAYDVYHALYKDYFARVWGVIYGGTHVVWLSRKAYIAMLKKDGRWSNWKSRWTTQKRAASFVWHVGKVLVGSLLPGHHPDRVADPQWFNEWLAAYAELPEGRIPMLDTRDPDISVRFA